MHNPHPSTSKGFSSSRSFNNCYRCGKPHLKASLCPANGARCKRCGKFNHFTHMCRGGVIGEISVVSKDDVDEFTLGNLEINVLSNNTNNNDWHETLVLNGVT